MAKKDLSVEYAHIYTNQRIGKEQELTLEVLNEARSEAYEKGETTSLVVMVDDYSFPDPSFDYDEFITWLGKEGRAPEIVFRESQLIPVCDEVLGLIEDKKLKEQLTDYIKAKKYPCSLFIAAWYLLRLGSLTSPLYPEELQAERLLNILPYSFKPFEDKGLEIIQSTEYEDLVESINYRFIHGRLIA
jgi:hypothetical protein